MNSASNLYPVPIPSAAEIQQFLDTAANFPELLALAGPTDPRNLVEVREVVAIYLEHVRDEISPQHYENKAQVLELFVQAHGGRRVSQCLPLDLKKWLLDNRQRWRSAWTRQRVNATVQRAFNWGVAMKLIKENPFRGIHQAPGEHQRAMTDREYSQLVRHAQAYFRRFLLALKLTGARPGELRSLRWADIDWQRSVAVLKHHKTAKKTGRPRTIVLVPAVIRLLRWIRDHRPQRATALWLHSVLAGGPRKVREVTERAKGANISYRMLFLARQRLGVISRRRGGWASKGYYEYLLPEEPSRSLPKEPEPLAPDTHVFINGKGRPWKRRAICLYMMRLRKRAGMAGDCRLYHLRHRFGTVGVKAGINLKVLATLMGHAHVSTTEMYVHVSGDVQHLLEAAQKLIGTNQPDKRKEQPQ